MFFYTVSGNRNEINHGSFTISLATSCARQEDQAWSESFVPITAPQTINPSQNMTQTTSTTAIQSHNPATAAMKTHKNVVLYGELGTDQDHPFHPRHTEEVSMSSGNYGAHYKGATSTVALK